MAKGKNKSNNKIAELTDLLKGMSPTQLATLEGLIAGERQGENVRGLQDYENTAAAAPGLGVATAAPATAFGNLPTLSDTSARAGAGREAIAASERAATQRNLATQASENTGIQPEKGRSRLEKLWGGIKSGVKSAADWANQGDFKDPRRGIRPRNVSPQEWEARGGRVQQQEDIAANKHGLMGPSYSGFGAAAPAAPPAAAATTTPTQAAASGGGRTAAQRTSSASQRASAAAAQRRAMARGRRQGGRTATAPDAPRVAPAPGVITRANAEKAANLEKMRDVYRQRPAPTPSPTGASGPQDQMTEVTEQVSSRRNVPGPRAKTPQERQKEVMSTATDMPVGSAGALQAAGEKINTGGAQMRPAPLTTEQTFGNALYGGATSPDAKAGAAMSEDPGRVRADAEPQVRLMELEKQAAYMMQRLQAGDTRAQAQLEGIFSEVDRIESQVRGAGRPTRTLDRGMSGTSSVRGGQGTMGGARVPSVMQSRNLSELRAQYNAIRNAPNAGGRSQRRAR